MKLKKSIQALNGLLVLSILGISLLLLLTLYQSYSITLNSANDRISKKLHIVSERFEHLLGSATISVKSIYNVIDSIELIPKKDRKKFIAGYIGSIIQPRKFQYNGYIAFEKKMSKALFDKSAYVQTATRNQSTGKIDTKIWLEDIYQSDEKEVWYHVAKKSEQIEATPIYYDTTYMKTWLITVSKGLYKNGIFEGMAGVDISVQELLEFVKGFSIGKTGGIAVFNSNTAKEVRFDQRSSNLFIESFITHFSRSEPNATTSEIIADNGRNYLVHSYKLLFPGWTIVAYQEKLEAMSSFYQKNTLYLFVVFLVIVLLLVAKARIEKTIIQSDKIIDSQRRQNEADRRLASMARMTAGIAHEIKNPLNIILNSGQVVSASMVKIHKIIAEIPENSKLNEEVDIVLKSSDKVKKHCMRAGNIIKNMLALSRSDSVVFESLDLKKLIEEAIDFAKDGHRERFQMINITTKLPAGVTCQVYTEDLSRAIVNILDNAIDALWDKLEKGSKFSPTIEIELIRSDESMAEIMISDNGGGIPVDIIDRVFDPFFTTKPSVQGTGLGLSLVDDIVRRHGGTIGVTSNVISGTIFSIKIPRES